MCKISGCGDKRLSGIHHVTQKNRQVVDGTRSIEMAVWLVLALMNYWNETEADRKDKCVKARGSIETGREMEPRLNLQEWMNTRHVPQWVTQYGRPVDCLSKSGFASFPLVLLSNEEHSSPRGCAGVKWKKDRCIYFLWRHTKGKKKIKQNKAFFHAWKGSIITTS